MAKGLFPPRPAPIASYDWIDMVSATGYIVFDGVNAPDSTGNHYILIEESKSTALLGSTFTAQPAFVDPRVTVDISGNGVGGTPGKGTDIDFDSSILQLPKTIEGDAYVRLPVSGDGIGGNDPNESYFVVRLRRYNATEGEVEIALITSNKDAISDADEFNLILRIAVPKTLIKKGDIIRLTIEMWSEDAVTHKADLGHNPDDTTVENFSAGNSRLCIALPFKLDFM